MADPVAPTQTQTLTIEQALQLAVARHQASQFREAEQLYRAILQAQPHHAEANHSLGVLAVQTKQPAASLPYFEAALAANPDQTQYWLNYIEALLQAGLAAAASQVLELMRQRGMPEDVLQACAARLAGETAPARQATSPGPQETDALISRFNDGQYVEAANLGQAMARQFPQHELGWRIWGMALKQLGRDAEALPPMQKAAELVPGDADIHNVSGMILRALGRLDEAESSYRKALRIQPAFAAAHSNLGNTLLEAGRPDEAAACFRQALHLMPGLAETHYNLGRALQALGRLDEAEASIRRAIEVRPGFAGAHYELGVFLLAGGRYAEGWREYEHRWEGALPRPPALPTRLPQWLGQEAAPGDRLLVFEEQGLGDKLQFSRYLPLAAQRFRGGVSCVVCAPLRELFRRSFPDVELLDAAPGEQGAWQWQSPLLSLPLAFGTTLENIPRDVPYLRPDPAQVDCWKARIDALNLPATTRKIGVVWKTGSLMTDTAQRNLALQQLSPLLNLPGCVWFSLQKEADPGKASWMSCGKLVDWSDDFGDFDATAALAANLDLVVSIDTSVAHLAGALGKPVWLFNRHAGEWRWMRDREGSPWYPTMRIFTQKTAGDWDEVVARMSAALRAWLR